MPDTVSIYEVKELIGEEAVQKMIEAYAGKIIYIKKKRNDFPDDETRNQYIKNSFFITAKKPEHIADEVGLSVDRVKKIICQR